MREIERFVKTGGLIAALLAGLLVSGPAAGAGQALSGFSRVQARDVADRSVTLGDGLYWVTPETRLLNVAGKLLVQEGEVDGVYFEARSRAGRFELELLRVVKSLPK
jgi:hypothetical protein